MFPNWGRPLIAVSASFHSVAIFCTLFRHWYRWHIARMWWDDAWAALALMADIACLIVTLLEQPIPHDKLPRFFEVGNWIFSFAYPTLMWSTRISILASIVRVSHPEGILRRIAFGIGISFGLMGIAVFVLRLQICIVHACLMTRPLLITQTTTDCVADVLLSVFPLWFLGSMKLSRQRKILLSSAFSATMVINIITVVEAVMLFQSRLTSGSIIFEHVKVACSLIVCNLLVIDTFVYRVFYKDKTGVTHSIPQTDGIELTTIELYPIELSQDTSKGRSTTGGMTESSSWSFHDSRSKIPGSVTAASSWTGQRTGKNDQRSTDVAQAPNFQFH